MPLMEYADPTAVGGRTFVSPTTPLPAGVSADVMASGTLAALNASVGTAIGARDTLVLAVTGTWVGTISLQGSLDNVTWFTINGPATWLNVATGVSATAVTATGLWQATVSAIPYVRVALTAYTSGSASVIIDITDGNAMVALDAPLPTGTNWIGKIAIGDGSSGAQVKGSGVASATTDNSLVVTQSPNYVAAATGYKLASAASTNATAVKASAGTLMQATVVNTSASTVYVKVFDKASAPTVGTDAPVDVIPVAAGGRFAEEYGQYGKRFPTGIALAITGAAADADATAVATGVRVHLTYL